MHEGKSIVYKLVLHVLLKDYILNIPDRQQNKDFCKKQIFLTPVADLQPQTIRNCENSTHHLLICCNIPRYTFTRDASQKSLKEIQNPGSSMKITWFHRSKKQFKWTQAHIKRFCLCLNINSVFKIGTLVLYPS